MSPSGLRGRLTLLVALGATLVLAGLTTAFNVLLRASLEADADRVVRSRADSALETVAIGPDGSLRLLEAPPAQDAGSGIWIYSGRRALERPPAPESVQRLADSLAGRGDSYAEGDSDVRLFALAVPGARGTVVAALSVEPYERTADRALIASLIFAAVTLAGIIAVARALVGRALAPVSRMTAEATEWSEHDLDHRFGVGEPHDELTGLAAAFDSMLDRLASTLRHEQRLSAEISHELRTPLAAIIAEAELALARGGSSDEDRLAHERIAERAGELRRILDTLLAASRAEIEPGALDARVAPVVERAMRAAGPLAERSGVRLVLRDGGDDVVAAVDEALLERILGPLIENGCRYARSSVELSIEAAAAGVAIDVRDDGPGLASGEGEEIFEAGVRGEAAEAAGPDGGAGLGLALSRRLARAAGGDVNALAVPPGEGGAFRVTLPRGGT